MHISLLNHSISGIAAPGFFARSPAPRMLPLSAAQLVCLLGLVAQHPSMETLATLSLSEGLSSQGQLMTTARKLGLIVSGTEEHLVGRIMKARDTHMGLTKAQLQQKARILGCPASGTKAQLVDRMIQHVAKLRPSQTPAPSCTSTSTGSSGHQQPAASSTAPPQQTPPPSSTDTSSSGPRQPTGEVWAGVAEFYLFAGYGDDTERFQMVSDSYDGVVSAFDQEADRDRYSGYNILNIWKVEPKSGDS